MTDAIAKSDPDLSNLADTFIIYGTQKFKNYSSVNGQSRSEEGWQISLKPKMAGELIIPAISLNTNVGVLTSQAINILVEAAANLDDSSVQIEGTAEKQEIFVQEPFIFTVKILNATAIANASLDKFEIPNCVVDELSEPKRSQTMMQGKRVQVTQMQYLITPLKEGELTIPPIVLRGEALVAQTANGGSLDPFDHLTMLGLRQSQEYEHFVAESKTMQLKVKSALPEVQPWLPLQSLSIEESWEGLHNSRVGEAITRKVKLHAVGATGKQLPNLKKLHEIEGLKVYADNPIVKYELDTLHNNITGSREELLSLIPTQSGSLTIPAISIEWWDLKKNKKTVTTLAAKSIDVLPAMVDSSKVQPAANSNANKSINQQEDIYSEHKSDLTAHIKILYGFIGLLIVIVLLMLVFVLLYYKRMQKLTATRDLVHANTVLVNNKSNEVRFIHDIASLQSFICSQANKIWGLPPNLVITEIMSQLMLHDYDFDHELGKNLFIAIDRAMYGGEQAHLEDLKKQWYEFNKTVKNKSKSSTLKQKALAKLNPT